VVINDEFRITLRMKTEKPPSVYWHGFPRLRFAYAHELIHCLNYDLSCRPPKRIAPRAMKNEEEEICNYGAGLLVLPVHLVKEYLATLENVDFISKATLLATKSQTSLHASVLHLINEGYLDDSKNKIYIFSQNSEGYHGRGIKKPRCIISIIYLNDDPRKYFLPVYKGLEALGVSFSLIKFHDNMFENSSLSEIKINNEIIRFSGKAFLLEGYHRRVGNSGYVWSDLSVLELETK
jgi:hypothetical protein